MDPFLKNKRRLWLKGYRLFLVFFLLTVFSAPASIANARVVFGDANFNKDTIGEEPIDSHPGFTGRIETSLGEDIEQNGACIANSILVAGQPAGFTSQALEIQKNVITCSPVFRGVFDDGYSVGIFRVTWRSSSEQSAGGFGYAAISNDYGNQAFVVIYDSSGSLHYRDDNGDHDTGISYTINTPQTFQALLDLDTNTFNLSIDGQIVASDRPFQNAWVNAESGAGVIQQFVWGIGGAGTETYAIDSIRVDKLEAESICKEDQVQDLDYGTTYSLGINDDNPIEGHVSQSFMPDEPYLQAVELKMRMGGSFPSSEYYATTINIREGSPSGIVLGTATAIIPAGILMIQSKGCGLGSNFRDHWP